MSWCYKYLTFLMLAIALLPLSALAGASQDATTSDVSTIYNPRSKTQNTTGWQERPDFGKYFQQAGVEGTFLLYDLKQKQYLVYNSQRANTSIVPVSTFKIFNSLVALETGVIQDENEVIKWDGTPQKFPDWNQDQTMRSAIAGSVIWFYQRENKRIYIKRKVISDFFSRTTHHLHRNYSQLNNLC